MDNFKVRMPFARKNTTKKRGCWKGYWIPYLGHALIKTVELEIAGVRIDKHYGEWL